MLKYHIQTVELTSAQATISFNSIPQDFSDLYILMSLRGARANNGDGFVIRLNGTLLTRRYLYGTGSSVVSGTADFDLIASSANSTANTFGNASAYISNYSSSNSFKSVSMDGVSESNETTSYQNIASGLYSSNSPVTNIEVTPITTLSWLAGSSISLYGVRRGDDGVTKVSPVAIGGTVTTSGGYTIHTFTSSGTLSINRAVDVEYLVVGGGGGGGSNGGGGGGAGGYRSSVTGESSGGGASAEAKLSLTAATNYTVTVGAGGSVGNSGTNSVFGSITSTGGGRGSWWPSSAAANGGSGGGASSWSTANKVPGTGALGQGFDGGSWSNDSAGGGGGAGQAGFAPASNLVGGLGGNGVQSSINGTATYRAGGGAGGGSVNFGNTAVSSAGGLGGGGNSQPSGGSATAGGTNTGGGGGGAFGGGGGGIGAAGGSGVVIIRYLTPA